MLYVVSPPKDKYLHSISRYLTTSAGGDTQLWIETLVYDTSTKRGSNLTPFNKISKSGDGEGNGDIFPY